MTKYISFFLVTDTHVPSDCFKGGTGGCARRICLVFCQSELSVADKDMRCFVKSSDLILAKVLLSLLVKWLNNRLSEGYLVLCHVARAFLFSEIRVLTKWGRWQVGLLCGFGVEEDQAACCIDVVRVFR